MIRFSLYFVSFSNCLSCLFTFSGRFTKSIWRRREYFQIRQIRHRGRREVTMTELKEIIARIKETAVDAGIIMIEGELSGQGLYASRVAISEALMTLDPIGASFRWRDFTPRVKYNVPGNSVTWIRCSEVEVGYFIRQQTH